MPLRSLFFLLFLSLPLGAAALFVPPDPTEALFQRDLLPIDPDRMRSLSTQLTVLAARASKPDPIQFRATAQLLAVAGRLNPANTRVRALTQTYSRRKAPVPPDPHQLKRATSELWQMINWLQSDGAGPEGQRLGGQLFDALRVIDPAHPRSSTHDSDGEPERWLGVVAPLKSFIPRSKEVDPPPPKLGEPEPSPEPMPLREPDPGPAAPVIQLRTGLVHSPLFVYDKSYHQTLQVVPISLSVNDIESEQPLNFGLDPNFQSTAFSASQEQVRSALLTLWPALPQKQFAVLSTDQRRYAARNGTAVTAAAGLLLHAALSEKPLRSDLTILGDLQSDGTLTRPKHAWEYLSVLRKGPGGRLLVTPDLKEELHALLVLEDPGFFIKYEVLVVSSLDAALRFGTLGGDPQDLVTASTVFAEIQSAAKGRKLGPLTVLESVRERLISIRKAAPYHLSASALLIQGSGKDRPTKLTQPILARELSRALEPMSWVIRANRQTLNANKLLASWKICRKRLDAVERFTNIQDRPLHQQAQDILDDVRTLGRELMRSGRAYGPKAGKALSQIRSKYSDLLAKVATVTGEPLEMVPMKAKSPPQTD